MVSLVCTQVFADTPSPAKPAVETIAFKPFTGKILGNKVRMRSKPDFDGHIIRQLNKNDLLLVVGEEGDFWAVQPPRNTKAYVFRSYVIDNTVEAAKVNIRLEPHVDAPVIGQLRAGDKISAEICMHNNKWLEIAAPSSVRFYVSKEFVSAAGGPEFLERMEKKRFDVSALLASSYALAEAECKKPFEEMDPKLAITQFEKIVQNYAEFEEELRQAKEGLLALEDNYIKKKVAFLEGKPDAPSIPEVVFPKVSAVADVSVKQDPNIWQKRNFFTKNKNATSKMKYWQHVEEGLYASWANYHNEKKPAEFYQEQKVNATTLKGTVECYDTHLKNRPGDYILKEKGAPVAYLYSTQIDLDKSLGKNVNLVVSPRPNHHFAFPAYFVLEVQQE